MCAELDINKTATLEPYLLLIKLHKLTLQTFQPTLTDLLAAYWGQ